MNHQNPIVEDYKLLVVFKHIGLKLLQHVKDQLAKQPYAFIFKDVALPEPHELRFSYLGYPFSTRIEAFFNFSRMPKTASIATYHAALQKEPEEIVRYSFDLDFVINDVYTLENFAEYYLIEFHENLKKTFSEHHTPFLIRIGER